MRLFGRTVCLWLGGLVLLPTSVYAQASIAGIVKDTSGAVLPGVTVEAASPALIERTRSVVTDGTGQYKVVDLRPGIYAVTFTLSGFNTVKREAIELTGSFAATVNIDLKVGAIEETIIVTGETPVVDVQSVEKQRVLGHDVIDAIPTGKVLNNLTVLVPGVSIAPGTGAGQDVGGAGGDQMTFLVAHGTKTVDSGINVNGIQWGSIQVHGSGRVPNMLTIQEITVDTASASAELPQAGPMINFIPREGGNTFRTSFYGDFANHSMQGSNITQDLIDRGLRVPNSIKKNYDATLGVGGPVRKDRLWFYGSVRQFGTDTYVGAGNFINRNANNPNAWTYDPDPDQPTLTTGHWLDAYLRLTWQVNARNKLAISHDQQYRCGQKPNPSNPLISWEATSNQCFPLEYADQADWTASITNRLLLQAGGQFAWETFRSGVHSPANHSDDATNAGQMISVNDQFTGFTYRAPPTYSDSQNHVLYPRVAISYVTGAHAFKVGYNDMIGRNRGHTFFADGQQPLDYRFSNVVPNQITEFAAPYISAWNNIDHGLGLYVQDKWTVRRMTLNLGVRYDLRSNSFPEEHLGPGLLVPTRNLTFAAQPNEHLHDIEPRLGMAYDLFGTGKTAVKLTLNKYVVGGTGIGNAANNPVSTLVNSTTRTWTDRNANFIPDCDLTNPQQNNECAKMANTNFGTSVPGSKQDPDLLTGWGRRMYNWEFSGGVQQRLAPRVSMEATFFRRWYGNFAVTDNLAVSAADFDPYSITAPVNPLLPGGGGYTIGGLYDVNPLKFGVPANNYVTFSDNYGSQTEHWNGVDLSVNARLPNGLLVQGGLSTGRDITDNCEIIARLPEISPSTPASYCRNNTGFLTQVKLVGAYTIPKALVQVSAVYQDLPGPAVSSTFTATNALVKPSLGRDLSAGATSNVSVNLVTPGTQYGDRVHQLDVRFAKILKYGRTRTALNFDLYNALNANPVLLESTLYSSYRQPQQILLARFAKVSVNVDF